MSEKILACPFPHCGSERCEIYKDSQLWYVFCDGCGSEGPFANTEAEAIALWNAAANALAAKDAEIERLVAACDDLEGEYLRVKEQRDEALKKLNTCQDMYQLNLEYFYDLSEKLEAERDEARKVAQRYYNAANAWMKNWTELINALPARNEPQSVRVTETSEIDGN